MVTFLSLAFVLSFVASIVFWALDITHWSLIPLSLLANIIYWRGPWILTLLFEGKEAAKRLLKD